MSKALYNKYRSQDFDSLIGQDHITKILKNSILKNRIANAYLFVGSRGTGKTSTARIMAKALNCSNIKSDGNPCCECDNCKGVVSGNFVDLIEIDAASNRGIDQIRDLKEKIEFAPARGKYKIYIIDEVHMLTKEAFNALLKTLEEPPKHIVFILATTDFHKLPPTILSRCQRYDFKLGTTEDISKTIIDTAKAEDVNLDDSAVEILVANAKGSYRDALSLLDVVINSQLQSDKKDHVSENEVRKALGVPDYVVINNLLNSLMLKDKQELFKHLMIIDKEGINISQLVGNVLNILNDNLIKSLDNQNEIETIISLVEVFLKIDKDSKYSSYPFTILQTNLIKYVNQGEKGHVVVEMKKIEVKEEKKIEEKVEKIKEQNPKDIVEDTDESEDTGEEIDVVHNNISNVDLSMDVIKDRWNDIISNLKAMNPRLAILIKSANPCSVSGNMLSLSVPYQFHKDTLDNLSNKEVLVMSLKKLFNCEIKVDINVDSNMKSKKKASADILMKAREISNTPASTDNKQTDSSKGTPVLTDAQKEERKAKFNKKVEEIFAGM